jgi:long-chain fatty acid transport protein
VTCRFLNFLLIGLAVLLAASVPASGQGYGVYEQGACMMGRAGAGVADPCADGSGVFFNPAALSFTRVTLTAGGALIGPSGTFTNWHTGQESGLKDNWYPVPNFYASVPFRNRVALGVGVFAPYGLTTEWPAASEGRYLGYKSLVHGVYVQPTVAIRFSDRVSVGVGVDITHLSVEMRQRVDLSSQPLGSTGLTFAQLNLVCPSSVCGTVPAGTDFADVKLEGRAWHPGFHVGVQVKVSDRVTFGARLLSGQTVGITNGTITTTQISVPGVKVPVSSGGGTTLVPVDVALAPQFAEGGKLSRQSGATSLPMPAQFVTGLAFRVAPAVKMFTDFQFTNWASFAELPITGQYLVETTRESYRDTGGLRVGAEINAGRRAVVRFGVNAHRGAAPSETVTPNLPEGGRYELNAGFGYQVAPRLRFDAAYMYLGQPDRAGRSAPGANNGVYRFRAHLLGVSGTVIM